MARQRRNTGGRRSGPTTPLDLPAALGSFLRSTLEQVSFVGEAAIERAREQRERLSGSQAGRVAERFTDQVDTLLLERKRRDALARLGEYVYARALRGELDQLADDPTVARALADIEDVEERLEQTVAHATEQTGERRAGERRVGERRAGERRTTAPLRAGSDSDDDAEADDGDGDDDGVVSSAGWRPPPPRSAERMRVWRPDVADLERHQGEADEAGAAPQASGPGAAGEPDAPEPVSRSRRRRSRASLPLSPSGGGIAFVSDDLADPDDEDLSAYMHEGDVPDPDGD